MTDRSITLLGKDANIRTKNQRIDLLEQQVVQLQGCTCILQNMMTAQQKGLVTLAQAMEGFVKAMDQFDATSSELKRRMEDK